ncbi:MAG: class I SAM-dependent methyltransferase, partial [Solirubrobacteraceae bacterium]
MEARSPEEIRDVNTRYHDVAAGTYDTKWGIDFGDLGQSQTLGKLEKALGTPAGHYPRALEIGAGTGYFSLNLLQRGVVGAAVATDISPGMLETLQANAARLGLAVETVTCDAEALPFADGSFDLVIGHAVLHHLPDLGQAFSEFFRVLRPEGTLVFAGEPSRYGDRLARIPKRTAAAAAQLWRRDIGAAPVAAAEANGNP